ncbi:conserved hypothetical protein [Perkinsus marinus ATCC 50983]|uniref:DNA/RNA-binding protein Alba-like domain-containing protein n=1 Tax=Perkinsus marinus (strain ATCC 50983 / TXsc) TaxID=423536 RepID=C5L895_PERM5|nr:conserved hypothetical protein [Perkinsus marinus ATCC 50983]EER07051.1 conserved hypothetical protein [Perkinsus marinus ATCC 50983]|eukprot:XP_002775235.1 conserved hypothetical protein [Perkinsus marinus ATCC 50983]
MVTKFRRVQKTVGTTAPEEGVSEVRVTSMGRVNAFVEEAIERLVGSEKHVATKQIKVMARGTAIAKAVIVSEILSRRVPSLSQEVELGSSDVEDVFEPVGEHDDDVGNVTQVRIVPSLVVTLKANKEIKQEDIKEHEFIKRPALADPPSYRSGRPTGRSTYRFRPKNRKAPAAGKATTPVKAVADSTTEDDSAVKKQRRDRRRRKYKGKKEQDTEKVNNEAPLVGA